MSWDIFVAKVPKEYKTTEDIPEDYMPPIIGTKDELRDILSTLFPDITQTDSIFLNLERDEYSVEVSIGDAEEVDSLMFFIRGKDSVIDEVLLPFTKKTGLGLLDSQTGKILFEDNLDENGMKEWKEFRNKVVNNPK